MTTFKSVGGNSETKFLKPEELADLSVQGKYLGVVEGKFGSNYKIETAEGTVIINGCGALNSQMPKVSEGATIRLEYRGKKKIPSGPMKGKTFHDIDVQVASAE